MASNQQIGQGEPARDLLRAATMASTREVIGILRGVFGLAKGDLQIPVLRQYRRRPLYQGGH